MRRLALLAAGAGLLGAPPPSPAQSLWTRSHDTNVLEVEWQQPSLSGEGFDLGTHLVRIGLREPLTDGLTALVAVPIARVSGDGGSGTTMGNPYLGLVTRGDTLGFFELGITFPLLRDFSLDRSAADVGLYTDPHRMDEFVDEVLSVQVTGNFAPRSAAGSPVWAHFRLGPRMNVVNRKGAGARFHVVYGFGFAAVREAWRAGIVVTGRYQVTSGGSPFGDRSVHQVEAHGDTVVGGLYPRAGVRLPLDGDLSDVVDLVMTAGVGVPLR